MANDIRGELGFEALGKSFTLKFGNGAVRHVENETGLSISEVAAALTDPRKMTATLFTRAFHGALLRHHPDLTIETVDDIIDSLGSAEAGSLLAQAVALAYPAKAQGGEAKGRANPRKATAGSTGSR
jgi:hypothetical protein